MFNFLDKVGTQKIIDKFKGDISTINNNLSDKVSSNNVWSTLYFKSNDFNKFLKNGFYRVDILRDYVNAPSGAQDYGQLIVSCNDDTCLQIYQGYNGSMYKRSFVKGQADVAGAEWQKVVTNNDLYPTHAEEVSLNSDGTYTATRNCTLYICGYTNKNSAVSFLQIVNDRLGIFDAKTVTRVDDAIYNISCSIPLSQGQRASASSVNVVLTSIKIVY